MAVAKINGVKLKQAVEKFGSLEKAIENLKHEKEVLEKERSNLKKENEGLKLAKEKLIAGINALKNQFSEQKGRLQSLAENFGKWERQYNLFQGFIAMLLGSPAADTSLKSLMSLLQELTESGWAMTKKADDFRSHFVRTIMGDYLKCFHCDSCGAKFITNKKPENKFFGNGYQCPVCHNWYAIKEDDSFLKALISEQQLEDTQYLEKVLEEHELLLPFKAFLNVPCEICHEPIEEWDDYNVKLAIEGIGCGHTSCWKSESGQMKELLKAIQQFKKDTK